MSEYHCFMEREMQEKMRFDVKRKRNTQGYNNNSRVHWCLSLSFKICLTSKTIICGKLPALDTLYMNKFYFSNQVLKSKSNSY